MADLRTDYKDDLLDTSVNTQRKYRMVTNDDGTVSFVDETVYTQNGDTFGAREVNQIHAAVNLVNESLTVNFSNMSSDVQNVQTLLQLLGERFYPARNYLYKLGDQYTDKTGGWGKTGYQYTGDFPNSKLVGITDSDNGLILKKPSSGVIEMAGNINAIDVTNMSKIYIKTNISSAYSGGVRVTVSSSKTNYSTALTEKYINSIGEYTTVIDVTSLSGLVYICLSQYDGFYSVGLVEEIWYE